MRHNFLIIMLLLSNLLKIILTQSNESSSEENNLLLKRSLDKTSLRDLLATRSLENFDTDIKSLSDLVKRQDANKSKVSDTFLKTLLKLSPPVSASKSLFHQDLSSILNTSDFEDEEIFKKSQALGLSINQSITTTTTTSTTTTLASTKPALTTTYPKDEDLDSNSKDDEDDDEDEDFFDAEKAKSVNRKISKKAGSDLEKNKLSSKQLKQIYKFLRKKEKKSKKKNSVDNLLSSLMSSPNYEVHLRLRDSLAAKAANDALLKWHSKAPFASLNQLEEMYNKFFEFYYDYFDTHSGHDHFYDHHHRHHHHGHYHHPHHDHHHLNLLDFLASKNSDELEPKNSLYEKIVGSDYLTRHSLWNDYHHTHYPEHYSDHYHDHHDYDHYEPYHDNIYLPSDHHHQFHDFQTHFNNPNPHHHYHYSQHPVYDDYGHRLIYTTGQLERFPPSNSVQDPGQSRPVVCTNYPDHSSEGFKSFISVESCNQPSFLGSNGVPLFGNGCVFKYMCELGYQPVGGITSSIKCNNGFWTARAICLKQGIGSNQSNANLLKRSDQNLSESENKRAKRSDEEVNSAELNVDYDQLINSTLEPEQEQVFTTRAQSVQNSSRQSLILDKLMENFKVPTTTKPTYESTSSPIVDPVIDWSNIINSDSEKTIYESFYELLENGSNKLAQNLDLFDMDKF